MAKKQNDNEEVFSAVTAKKRFAALDMTDLLLLKQVLLQAKVDAYEATCGIAAHYQDPAIKDAKSDYAERLDSLFVRMYAFSGGS